MRGKVSTDKKNYLFDNKALAALIIPLIVEQLLAVLVGMADSIMVASVGSGCIRRIIGGQHYGPFDQRFFCSCNRRRGRGRSVSWTG